MSIWSIVGGLLKPRADKSIYTELRELVKGKEADPQKAIDLQVQINAMEAQHRTVFVAGWRPFIGWVCGFSFAFHYIGLPLIATYAPETVVPDFDLTTLSTILFGMLGLGGMRTYEKMQGKAK